MLQFFLILELNKFNKITNLIRTLINYQNCMRLNSFVFVSRFKYKSINLLKMIDR